ncbi:signal peptidase I SipW [Sediminibacillus halophilus]|uniref:Signal peptidase I n=1 Tax=Sediminibacillus halophilus TaxID=482461 RepID=A0A1G9VBR2_9BACI|nr:signal peptidase I [Sediminibacillus halophilus]SDM69561.1 signal peptidase, endoplasmic reticulum-type [Sediminibacillus halophilus]
MKKGMKWIMRWLSRLVTFTLFATLLFMVFVVISSKASGGEPQVMGYQLKTVLSGSMEPGIKTGSIIAVKPGGDMTRFEKGDVITFQTEEELLITHRIVDVTSSGDNVLYETKGDNNDAADREPVLSQNVIGEYTGFTIPFVGYFISFAQSKEGSALLLILPGFLLLGYAGFTIWQTISQLDAKSKKAAAANQEETTES